MHEVLVNCLGGLSLPRISVIRLTDRPDMTSDVYCGRKTIKTRTHTHTHTDDFHAIKPSVCRLHCNRFILSIPEW